MPHFTASSPVRRERSSWLPSRHGRGSRLSAVGGSTTGLGLLGSSHGRRGRCGESRCESSRRPLLPARARSAAAACASGERHVNIGAKTYYSILCILHEALTRCSLLRSPNPSAAGVLVDDASAEKQRCRRSARQSPFSWKSSRESCRRSAMVPAICVESSHSVSCPPVCQSVPAWTPVQEPTYILHYIYILILRYTYIDCQCLFQL